MAHAFRTLCQEKLQKELQIRCPNLEWETGKRIESSGKNWKRVEIDIYGENAGFVVCVEFEMHRRNSQDNALKLFELLEGSQDIYLWKGKKVLIIHIFSPFYEVDPHRNQLKGCEAIMPKKFESIGVSYQTFRWNLDRFCKVCKACLTLPDSKNHFPPSTELDEAISALAKELRGIIDKWAP
jgi:hypothetical protein